MKILRKIFITIVIILSVIFIIKIMDLRTFKIVGNSMNPTLYENEIVLSKKVKLDNLKRQDLIVFDHHGNTMVKRVIGLPGDTIAIDNEGYVYVNNVKLEENYIDNYSLNSEVEYPYVVSENSVYVLGDNRIDSMDSRILSFGLVKNNEILGKVTMVLYKPRLLK